MLKQIIKFCLTGGLCTVIDFGVLFVLTEQIGLSYIISNIISVSLSTIVNYILSKIIVFNFSNTLKNFIVFVVLSIIGLVINEGLIILCVNVFTIDYKVGKIIATGVVMCFNYLTRKYMLKEK
jgi:putative flippase GtrA